ncbi:MAG TPA: hypothetical protein VKD43_15980 [Xanthobacteraceae bacterium]|nr:hypothetical protein [Xanthobacteraceae bacterium]
MTSTAARIATAAGVVCLALAAPVDARADSATECTAGNFCYCVDTALKAAIDQQVAAIRSVIAKQRSQAKAIGYLSVPLSTIEGSYLPVNAKVAAQVKEQIEDRFGVRAAWVLNPGAASFSLPQGTSGAAYMLMWTRVLEGDDGLAPDFDFVYFVGPADFTKFFGLDGRADMEKLDAYYDGLAKTDTGVSSINKVKFRNYYALRASVAFSLGSHDEWNIVRSINTKRRDADKQAGIVKQLAVFFEGRAVPPGMYEAPIQPGTAGACAVN